MPATREKATRIVRKLQNEGFIAYFAGGCVRDALMGVAPKDYDIATDALPDQVRRIFPETHAVGAHFGVILVRDQKADFEVATFRNDGIYQDGRHPEDVVFSTPEEDAKRRDFTINGMFCDPLADEVIDLVGGREDLEKKCLRAIGDPAKRFKEDHLRIMRAVRFATTLSFEIDPSTWKSLSTLAPEIARISIERVRDEFVRTLLSPNRVRGFDLLVESGIMGVILPEVLDLRGCEQPPQFHPEGDVFVHTRLMLELLPREASLPLLLSVLFHDIGKPATAKYDEENDRIRFNGHESVGARMTEEILRRFRFSNDVINATVEAVQKHMVFKDVQKMRVAKLKRFMARPHFDDEMELHRVDCSSSHGKLDNYEFLQHKADEFANEPLIPPRLLSGDDLKKMGWRPGKEIGVILTEAQNLQLEGKLQTHEEAVAWVRENFRAP